MLFYMRIGHTNYVREIRLFAKKIVLNWSALSPNLLLSLLFICVVQ